LIELATVVVGLCFDRGVAEAVALNFVAQGKVRQEEEVVHDPDHGRGEGDDLTSLGVHAVVVL
jgi:hypothetical protein